MYRGIQVLVCGKRHLIGSRHNQDRCRSALSSVHISIRYIDTVLQQTAQVLYTTIPAPGCAALHTVRRQCVAVAKCRYGGSNGLRAHAQGLKGVNVAGFPQGPPVFPRSWTIVSILDPPSSTRLFAPFVYVQQYRTCVHSWERLLH